jgi:LMBR1 domain-containing protein 1
VCGGIDFTYVWESLFCIICLTVVLVIPFSIVYYEADDGSMMNKEGRATSSKFLTAFCTTAVVGGGFLVLVVSLYFSRGTVNIPVVNYDHSVLDMIEVTVTNINMTITSDASDYIDTEVSSSVFAAYAASEVSSDEYVTFRVDFPIYVIALLGWIGWWSFSIFAGVGLVSLPFDLVVSFLYRPVRLSPDKLHQLETEVQERTSELIEITQILQKERTAFATSFASRGEKRKRIIADRLEMNKLNQMVYILQRDVEEMRLVKGSNDDVKVLTPYFNLIGGVISGFVSVIWLIHIIVYMLLDPPVMLFLDGYLPLFDSWFPMFGDLTYAGLALYLLLCTTAGCFKIGLRFLCINIHPMKFNGTYVNSFLFNNAVILWVTVPVIQFCIYAFSGYTSFTDAYSIFFVQIMNLNFYGMFYRYKVFTYIIFIMAMLTLLYMICRPRDVASSTEQFKMDLRKRGATAITGNAFTAASSSAEETSGAAPTASPAKSSWYGSKPAL